MSRVQLPSVQLRSGRFAAGVHIDGVWYDEAMTNPVTVYTAAVGGTTVTYPLVSDSEGAFTAYALPATVYIEYAAADDTVNNPALVELVSGQDLTKLAVIEEAALNIEYPEYGAHPSNSAADNGTAIQAAIEDAKAVGGVGGREIVVPPSNYDSTTLAMKFGATLKGASQFGFEFAEGGSRITGEAGTPVITAPDTGAADYDYAAARIEGLTLIGGTDSIYTPNGAVGLTIRDVRCQGHSRAGLSLRGFVQELFVRDLEVSAGQYGIYFPNQDGTGGTDNRFDKCIFDSFYGHGQSINGVHVRTPISNSVEWRLPRVVTCAQDGFSLSGGLLGWTFLDPSTEANGYLGASPKVANVTGTITGGTDSLEVSSSTGFAEDDTVTIAGAGNPAGTDAIAVIETIAGTTWTLVDPVFGSVTAAEVTKGRYSDVKLGTESGSPTGMTFVNFLGGIENADSQLRYAIDIPVGADITLVGCSLTRPVYDPNNKVARIGGAITLRPAVTADLTVYGRVVKALDPSLYWALDNRTGAYDLSGNGRHGTGQGAVPIGASPTSLIPAEANSTDLNGTDQYFTSSYAPFVDATVRTFAGVAWRDASATDDILIAGSNGFAFMARLNSGGNDVIFTPDAAATTITWAGAWPGNAQRVRWAFVFDETANTVSLSINGTLVSSQTLAAGYSNPGNFQVGAYDAGNQPFDGKMAHVAVWERGLTTAEITMLGTS